MGRTGCGEHGKGNALVMFEYCEKAPYDAELLADVLERSNEIVPGKVQGQASIRSEPQAQRKRSYERGAKSSRGRSR